MKYQHGVNHFSLFRGALLHWLSVYTPGVPPYRKHLFQVQAAWGGTLLFYTQAQSYKLRFLLVTSGKSAGVQLDEDVDCKVCARVRLMIQSFIVPFGVWSQNQLSLDPNSCNMLDKLMESRFVVRLVNKTQHSFNINMNGFQYLDKVF